MGQVRRSGGGATLVAALGLGVVGALAGVTCARPMTPRAPIVASASTDSDLGRRVESLAAGQDHTCALLDDGSVRCWGADHSGQLGVVPRPALPDGQRGSARPLPTVVLQKASALALGSSQTCLLGDAGVVRCVGERVHLEDSRKAPEAPQSIDVAEPVTALGAGQGSLCLLLESGVATCLGKAAVDGPLRGVLGGVTPGGIGYVDLSSEKPIRAVGVGADICTLHEDGTVSCRRSTEEFRERKAGENVEALALSGRATAISVSSDYGGCALLESHAVSCWNGAQFGPIAVSPIALDGPARQVDAGGFFSCAVLESGALRCWGQDGYFKAAAKPVAGELFAVDVGGPVRRVAVGELHACVLLESGVVRCFGHNRYGQLGYGHQRDIGDDESIVSAGDVPVLAPPARVSAWQAPPPSVAAPPPPSAPPALPPSAGGP